MPTAHPYRIAIHWVFSLSLLLGTHTAQAQDDSSELIGVLSGPTNESVLTGGGKATFIEPAPTICTIERSTDDFRPFPNINKYPLRVAGAGIEFGFKGQMVHTGHTATVVLNPLGKRLPTPAFDLVVVGPNGYHSRTPVEMTPTCEVNPENPETCLGTNSPTQFKGTELVLPALPHAGRYAMHLDLTIRGRRHQPQPLPFQVVGHPLAKHLKLPADYAETAQTEAPLEIIRAGESVYNGPSLVLCGQKNRTAVCIQTTQPISNCQEHLDAGVKLVQSASVPLIDATVGLKNNKAASRWCKNNQLISAYTNRRWGKNALIQALQVEGQDPQ
jgi:hypothetical protein